MTLKEFKELLAKDNITLRETGLHVSTKSPGYKTWGFELTKEAYGMTAGVFWEIREEILNFYPALEQQEDAICEELYPLYLGLNKYMPTPLIEEERQEQRRGMCIAHSAPTLNINRYGARTIKRHNGVVQYHPGAPCICGRGYITVRTGLPDVAKKLLIEGLPREESRIERDYLEGRFMGRDRQEFLKMQQKDMCIAHKPARHIEEVDGELWSFAHKQYRLDAPCICGKNWKSAWQGLGIHLVPGMVIHSEFNNMWFSNISDSVLERKWWRLWKR